ncbi:MAG: hypothetical protein M0P74_00795 [Syntrophales bacterium]|jgi:hypothetical protein|nr:hypothetical protein [Syntrophales bacterium]
MTEPAIYINPRDVESIRAMLRGLNRDEVDKANARGINLTLTGVRTDGTKILSDHYALTASAIRDSWKIGKAKFRDPTGVVSSQGTFIRLIKFGARQNNTGVSVKVLKQNPRATIAHAFIARIRGDQRADQVYWRKWKGTHKKPVPGRGYKNLPFQYRFPVKALYGPRIQDYLGDPGIIATLMELAGERLEKNMRHEVDYLLSQVK